MSHFSCQRTAGDACLCLRLHVQAGQPDTVLVELCEARTCVLEDMQEDVEESKWRSPFRDIDASVIATLRQISTTTLQAVLLSQLSGGCNGASSGCSPA